MSGQKHGCPHCGSPLFREANGGKLKARTSMVVLHKAGDVEINCGGCGKGVLIGAISTLGEIRKAEAPRPVVPRP